MTNKLPVDFDTSYEYDLNLLVNELNAILPQIGQYTIIPIGPGGGNPMVVILSATSEQLDKLKAYLQEQNNWSDQW